tara:strand:+ start:478 stop:1173 length:696 start_codon:yes stop_codon:yes gene_type:complete
MAARYVNPDNITAQGQYFYTGLPPGSYDSQGGRGAANVYGAGSGGSAGVSPDYTGADAGKSWQYPASFEIKLPIWDKDFGNPLAGTGGGGGGTGPQHPVTLPDPNDPSWQPGTRKRVPVSNAGPREERPQLPMAIDPLPQLPSAERPQITMGENPAEAERPMLQLTQYDQETRESMDKRNARDRARRASLMPAKDAIWGMTQVANADGTQGMWGAFTSSSASRSHSRPRTF